MSIVARTALGFRIASWSGDIAGKSNTSLVVLDTPKSAVLMLDRVPAIASFGVRSVVGESIFESVAPGSLISIFGANMAPGVEAGPRDALAQSLQNVTVRVENTFLPLVFVSPGQINAQLPGGMSPGLRNLVVRWEGLPETSAQFTVARSAPALFATEISGASLGLFLGTSGQTVTPDQPALAGDVLRLIGTGFGPYVRTPPDGFLFDETAGFKLADVVAVVLGDGTKLDVLYAGRSSAGVGIDEVRFRLPASPADAGTIALKLTIGGLESNTVYLPVTR